MLQPTEVRFSRIIQLASSDVEELDYVTRAYSQQAHNQFIHSRLYPELSVLASLGKEIGRTLNAQLRSEKGQKHEIIEFDQKDGKLITQRIEVDHFSNEVFERLRWVQRFLYPVTKEGRLLFEAISECIQIVPHGIEPLYTKEGYVIFESEGGVEVRRYGMGWITTSSDNYPHLLMSKEGYQYPILLPSDQLRQDLVEKNSTLPEPMIFRVVTQVPLPFTETLLPIVKRELLRQCYLREQ